MQKQSVVQRPLSATGAPARDMRLVRGAQLIEQLPDRAPEQADPRMRRLFGAVSETLRAPMINMMFRTLANYPDWLERTWKTLHPIVASDAFERAARGLRLRADAQAFTSADGSPLLAIEADARAFTETAAYVLPKSLLIAALMEHMLEPEGRPHPVRMRVGAQRRSRFGVPVRQRTRHASSCESCESWESWRPETVTLTLIDPESASGRLAAALEDIRRVHDHPRVASFYRGIGTWPTLLVRLWAEVRPLVGTELYRLGRDALVAQAGRGCAGFEAAAALDGAGRAAAGQDADDLQAIVAFFRSRMIPELLLDVSMSERLLTAGVPAHWRWQGTAH